MATRARPTTAEDLIDALRRRQRAIVVAYMRELVPSYDRHQDRLTDMREAGEWLIGVLLRAVSERRPIAAEQYEASRAYLRRALLRGASESELIRSARLWQRVVFDEVRDLAGPNGGALVAEISGLLIDHVDRISDLTAEVVEELQVAMRLTARDGRAELVADLLAGRLPAGASEAGTARACGLGVDTPLVVITARPVVALPDVAAGSVAAVRLAHAAQDAVEPLFAIREDEIVVIRATTDDPARLVEALSVARERLARDGVPLAVGVSAVHDGLAGVPAAHDEARLARERVSADGGILAIATMTPLDYLFSRGADATAWRLIDPRIRTFVEDDLSQAGLLVETLGAYVAANLNVKQAAERLFVHANTAHYRLGKIEEITGRDLRDLADLQELVIAVRLARLRTPG